MTLCLSILAGGCLQMEAEVTVKENRSGSADITYTLSEQTIAQFRQVLEATDRLAAAAGQSSAPTSSTVRALVDPQEAAIKEYFGALSPFGISLTDVRVRKAGGRRTVRLALSFADLEKAVVAPPLKGAGLRFGRRADGLWEFVRDGSGTTNQVVSASAINSVTPAMAGFVANIKVRVPGAVVETNAPRKSPRAVAWEFDFNREPQSVEQAFSAPLRVVYAP